MASRSSSRAPGNVETLKTLRWQTNAVEAWIVRQGWKVVQRRQDPGEHGFYCNFSNQTIETNTAVTPAVYLYSLLHECGHLAFVNSTTCLSNPRWISRNKTETHFKKTSKSYILAQFDEELDAWAFGESLAADLGIKLDWKQYSKHKTECLVCHARAMLKQIV